MERDEVIVVPIVKPAHIVRIAGARRENGIRILDQEIPVVKRQSLGHLNQRGVNFPVPRVRR